MGSGSSKHRKKTYSSSMKEPRTNYDKRLALSNTRSISVPSYNASIQKNIPEDNGFINHAGSKISSIPLAKKSESLCKPVVESSTKNANNNSQSTTNSSLDPECPVSKTDFRSSDISDNSSLSARELYNVLIAENWSRQPHLSEKSYLLLLDCRSKESYSSSRIVTAKHHTCLQTEYGCLIDIPGQLEAFEMIIVYGDEEGKIFRLLEERSTLLFKLTCQFSTFQTAYPFLCTDVLYKTSDERKQNLETWPSEIIDGQLYQGNASHALSENVVQHLGITHIVNITLDRPNSFPQSISYLRIQLADDVHVDLFSWLERTTAFIANAIDGNGVTNASGESQQKNRVLVHCNLGRSRSSTIVLGYLMKTHKWSLLHACDWLKDCRPTVTPNIGFLNQLLAYEKKLFGKQLSDFHQLPF